MSTSKPSHPAKPQLTEDGWRTPVQPSMKRRMAGWDYTQPSIYMLTLVVEDRRPLLGTLVGGDPQAAHIEPSALGSMVAAEFLGIPRYYPQIRIIICQLMPDHLHGILHVVQSLPRPLGQVVSGFKKGCERKRQTLASAQPALAPRLWEEGFNDKVLYGHDQLRHMVAYVRDNPRRLWLKRHRCSYFEQQQVTLKGLSFVAMGNLSLLQRPLLAVHIRRKWDEQERRDNMNNYILQARHGAVLVGAFISPYERQVLLQTEQERLPVVRLLENGFPELYKPGGAAFDACAEGRLLLLAPWGHHNGRETISRNQCQQLNAMAEKICDV